MNRREIIAALSASALLPNNNNATAQTTGAEAEPLLIKSKVYQSADLPTISRPHGQIDQTVLQGILATGEHLELHETTLSPGQMPHPSHHHLHSELMFVRSGLLESDNDGQKTTAGSGGVFFVGSNVPHAVKCVGEVSANYYVVAIGRN